jgi:hypothetical protein
MVQRPCRAQGYAKRSVRIPLWFFRGEEAGESGGKEQDQTPFKRNRASFFNSSRLGHGAHRPATLCRRHLCGAESGGFEVAGKGGHNGRPVTLTGC